ncbi:MAG: hypothetical protein WDW36_004653 [Sanguina aurantia]
MLPFEFQVCILLVTGKLKPGHIGKFVELFTELEKHVRANEEGALSYQLSISEEDPDAFIIFERYITKQYLEEVHFKSEAFKMFGTACRAAGIEYESKNITKYMEGSAVGYMAKA